MMPIRTVKEDLVEGASVPTFVYRFHSPRQACTLTRSAFLNRNSGATGRAHLPQNLGRHGLDLRKRSANRSPAMTAGWFAWWCLRPTRGYTRNLPDLLGAMAR